MNKPIKHLGILMVMCFLAIFLKLHQTQLLEVGHLEEQPTNARQTQRKLNQPRGLIFTADGAVLAKSENVGGNMVPRKRSYPEGELFGQITGYYSGLFKLEQGVEMFYDKDLTGATTRQQFDGLTNLFAVRENVGHVRLTLRKDLQELARQQLGDREGAITVLDPRTGAIRAMWSYPSYDPTALTLPPGVTVAQAQAAFDLFNANPQKPMLSKAYRERYNPGSTFKPVTAAAGLASGQVTSDRPVYPQLSSIKFPDYTGSFSNFGGETCGGALVQIMTVSCNTSFMQMGVDAGLPALDEEARKFGFLQDVPIDLPNPVQSVIPTVFKDVGIAGTAQTSIGQQENAVTPLQGAMDAAAIANNGVLMTPHVMQDVSNADGTVVNTYKPKEWLTALPPDKASVLREAMYGPTNNPGGTLTGRFHVPAGIKVGGKTGTAEAGSRGQLTHAWVMAFAGPAGQTPTVALSVVLLNRQGGQGDVTGGVLAGPVADVMMQKALELADAEDADARAVIAANTSAGGRPVTTTTTR